MAKPLRLGVAYDFRNPPESGLSHQALYAAIMDQVAWLDGLGLDLVWFTEHHFVDDGYLPSWIPVAAAMAARTRRVRFSCDVCLLPFNHPLRLAEDLAVLDNISGGRVEIGLDQVHAVAAGRRLQRQHLLLAFIDAPIVETIVERVARPVAAEQWAEVARRQRLEQAIGRDGRTRGGSPAADQPAFKRQERLQHPELSTKRLIGQ